MNIEQKEIEFQQKNKISLKEAIEKINKKKKESIDYGFLTTVYNDELYTSICDEQIEQIEKDLQPLACTKDNLLDRMIVSTIQKTDIPKRISDDVRTSKKVINESLVIDNILNSDYKFNPLLQLNEILYHDTTYPLIFHVTKDFIKQNREYIVPIKYNSSTIIREVRIKRWYEDVIRLDRDMITGIDLYQYPFYIRREIQNANLELLRKC